MAAEFKTKNHQSSFCLLLSAIILAAAIGAFSAMSPAEVWRFTVVYVAAAIAVMVLLAQAWRYRAMRLVIDEWGLELFRPYYRLLFSWKEILNYAVYTRHSRFGPSERWLIFWFKERDGTYLVVSNFAKEDEDKILALVSLYAKPSEKPLPDSGGEK